jgi:GTP-binding protein
LLVHVLDLAPLDGADPVVNYETVERELASHDPRLASLPRVLALSKADLVERSMVEAARDGWTQRLSVPVVVTSAVTGQGLDELAISLVRRIEVHPEGDGEDVGKRDEELAKHRVFRPAAGRDYRVERTGEHSFRVAGAGIERLVARYDLGNDEALAHLERRLRRIGVIRALEAEGFEPGDDVEIAGVEFELDPNV